MYTIYAEIFAICCHWQNFYHVNFLSCVNDYVEDMATFTAFAKIYSTKYFCNARVSGVGKIFVKRKFSHIQYLGKCCVAVVSVDDNLLQ